MNVSKSYGIVSPPGSYRLMVIVVVACLLQYLDGYAFRPG